MADHQARRSAFESQSDDDLGRYWTLSVEKLASLLSSSANGLSSSEAERRLQRYGRNMLRQRADLSRLRVLANQFRSPLLLLLVFAALVSAATREWIDAIIVLTVVFCTAAIGYAREYKAQRAATALQARVQARARVVRDGRERTIPAEELAPGDVVLLAAGSVVPADAVVLDATDFHVSQAMLTGESFPVQKKAGATGASATLADRENVVFLGTNVRSGTARCLVVLTGEATEFGEIARRLTLRPPESEFDRGIKRFGYLMASAMLIIVLCVFGAHMLRGRPPVETLLFSIALAIGLSPELLPAVLSVSLARGAELMASQGVLVRRLNAIENLGSMDILCTDKTGTLTEGIVELEGAYDHLGAGAEAVLELAAINAALETGIPSPLDDAILRARALSSEQLPRKLAEIPFDFTRKRVSVVVEASEGVELITKGAFQHVLAVCSRTPSGATLDEPARAALSRRCDAWSSSGIRVLALARGGLLRKATYDRADEQGLTFVGFLTFFDRPKADAAAALAALGTLGVSVKLITGDNRLVARHVASLVGLESARILTGSELDELHDEALWHAAERTDLFAEVDPNQKERIILALKKMGHVVGFLGDGVNDAPAMHAADTSLSVDHAVDVAREAADFVLLEQSLDVVRRGIEEGRRTFANTLKYLLATTSANLGNMVSMAAASLFLPFLPLFAGQILLNNLLSDVPAIGIADDNVDPELVAKPGRWDLRFIVRFMCEFGALSSLFDFITFASLLALVHATPELFRTGWFIESLVTELAIALVVRTRRPFFRSPPGRMLFVSTLVLIPFAFVIPFLPHASILGFVPPSASLCGIVAAIVALYVGATELLKRRFYRTGSRQPPRVGRSPAA